MSFTSSIVILSVSLGGTSCLGTSWRVLIRQVAAPKLLVWETTDIHWVHRCLHLMQSGKPPWCVTLERLMFMAGSVLWPANHLQLCTWSCEQAGKRTPLKCHHPTPSTRSGPCIFLRLWTPTSSGSNGDSSCDSEWFCSLSHHPFN